MTGMNFVDLRDVVEEYRYRICHGEKYFRSTKCCSMETDIE